jgi:chromosome segregation ATPase
MHKVEVLKVQVQDFTRNTHLMNTELELVKNAYSQSRQQYLAAEVEIKMLRTHLDAIKRDGDAQETASSARDEESKTANENSAHSARLFESVIQEKRVLEEALSKIRDEKLFVERCLTDARLNISRLEAEHESENTSLHEANLAVAKVEGKLQAANTRVSSLEKELQKKKDDILDLNDEIKRTRQSMIQSDSEKNLQNNTLRNELLFLKDQNEKMKREFDQLSIQHKELLSAHEDPSKRASEKTAPTAIESKLQEQKDQQLASFAEQLKGQKDKALQVRLNVCLCLCLCPCIERAIMILMACGISRLRQ